MDKVLQRTMFETSRALEYFTERELSYQTGHSKNVWPQVILKELMDNALDAGENASRAPEIWVRLHNEGRLFSISVEDNGPGIKPEVVAKILNFQTRTSDKEAYISPTRGAQGNALKTVIAIPYVLSTGIPQEGVCEIESRGIRHTIRVRLDIIKQEPRIEHEQAEIVKSQGCRVIARLEKTSIPDSFQEREFLQILADYYLFNPHLTLHIKTDSTEVSYEATNPVWRKWKPNDFTSPLWYSSEDLKKLVLAHVALAQDGGRDLTLREFVSQFRGITSTAKQKAVTSTLPEVKRLSDFVSDGDADASLIGKLLLNMCSLTKPVPPQNLGIIGEEHFKKVFKCPDISYSRKMGSKGEIPFVVEVAYVPDDTLEWVRFHFGLNFAPTNSDPLQAYLLVHQTKKDDFEGWGIKGLASQFRVSSWDKIHLVCHIACPRLRFKDRGKTILEIEDEQ